MPSLDWAQRGPLASEAGLTSAHQKGRVLLLFHAIGFGSEEAKTTFMKDPKGNLAKAEAYHMKKQ